MKVCKKCGSKKSPKDFYKEKRVKDGLSARCKDCCKSDAKSVFEANPEPYRKRARDKHRSDPWAGRWAQIYRKYKLTEEGYYAILEKQGGTCAICPATESGHNMTDLLLIDHCHETDTVRGLLCQDCNLLLGCINDEPRRLIASQFYLKRAGWGCDCQSLQALRHLRVAPGAADLAWRKCTTEARIDAITPSLWRS